MLLIQFAIIPISVSVASTIPLISNGQGDAIVSVTTGTHPPTAHRIYLGSNVITHISDSVPERDRKDFMRSFLTPSTFEGSEVTLVMEAREALIGPDMTSIGAWLAIGPTSDLVHWFGSVGYIKNGNPRLLLGLSEDEFLTGCRYCEPASAVRIPISHIPLRTMDGQPAHKIATAGSLEVNGEEIFGMFEYSPIETIFEMPILHFMTLFSPFIQRNMIKPRGDRTYSILSCTPAVIAEFPSIVVVFDEEGEGGGTGSEVSRLVITPADYIAENIDGSCRMRIGFYNEFLRPGPPTIGFNPLAIPSMIVRSTNVDMLLCKSKVERQDGAL